MARAIGKEKEESTPREVSSGTHRVNDRPTPTFDLRPYARSSMKLDEAPPRSLPAAASGAVFVDPASIPHLQVLREELATLELNHREGFLLSLIDERSTVEMILDICGMPEDEALFLFYELDLRGVIRLG